MSDVNQLKNPLKQSSSESDQNPGDSAAIIGDDKPSRIIITSSPPFDKSKTKSQKSVATPFPKNEPTVTIFDNQIHSQSQKNSFMSPKSRPSIYDEVERQQDNYGHENYQNPRQHGQKEQFYPQNRNKRQNQQQRHERNGYGREQRNYRHQNNDRKYNNQNRMNEDHGNKMRNGYHREQMKNYDQYEQSRNYEQQRGQYETHSKNQFNFQHHNQKYNQWDQYPEDYSSKNSHNRHQAHWNRRQDFQEHERVNFHNFNQQLEPESSKHGVQYQQDQNQNVDNRRMKQNQDKKQVESRNKHSKEQSQLPSKQRKPQLKPQIQEKPIKNIKKPSQKKEEQPPRKIQTKKSSQSNQSQLKQQASLNQAHSHITLQKSAVSPAKNNKNLDESSIWQATYEQDQAGESKSLEKSSFECHQISIQYPTVLPVIRRDDHNTSLMAAEDISLLEALGHKNQNEYQDPKPNKQVDRISKVPNSKTKDKNIEEKAQKQGLNNTIFTSNDLLILEKMFGALEHQDLPIFVEIIAKTQNVSMYKIKEISSQIFLLQNISPQQLKGHKFITIKDFQKQVPRDAEPLLHNRPIKQKAEHKTSRIILAQIKYPLNLLNYKEKLLAKFQSVQEKELIKKIENNKKEINQKTSIICIEQVTLKCSACNRKKSFLWKDQSISHQCNALCTNFLRFNIESINIC